MAPAAESVLRRRRWRLMLAYAVLLGPAIVLGAIEALKANNNSPIDWVSTDFAPRKAYDEYCQVFGPGDTVFLSWPGCTLYEPRLDTIVERVRVDRAFFDDEGQWLLYGATSGREAAVAMTSPQGPSAQPLMSPDQAIDRLRPSLVGQDRRTTAIVVTLTAEGLSQRARLVAALRDLVHEVAGVSPDQLRMAGPVIDGMSVDNASQATVARFAVPSAAIIFILCWLFLRSLVAAMIVFGLSLFCQAACLSLVHYSGESMSALMIVLPPMMQVLAIAGGLHLTNYFFDSGHTGERGVLEAVRLGWGPCVLSSATTVIGMASLMTSELAPIRLFGAYAAAGVALSTAVILALLPALYARAPIRPSGGVHGEAADRIATLLTKHVSRFRLPISVVGFTIILIGAFYAAQVKTSVQIETLFPAQSRILEDYAWLEANVGPLTPLDVVVAFPCNASVSQRTKLTLLWRIGERLSTISGLGPPSSAATLTAPAPDFSTLPESLRADVIEQFLVAQSPILKSVGVLREDETNEHWRLTVRASALGDADYGVMLAAVQEAVDEVVRDSEPHLRAQIKTTVTGIMPLVHEIQGQLLHDLLVSFAGALLLITITMTIVEAGILPGLVAMASNVFPIAVYFGWLGWRGHPIDIGVVMTASVALGIAVDDTLHFLAFFRRLIGAGHSRTAAVREALARCAPAMIQTSVVCGLGLLVFTFSDFAPTRGFATSMGVLLALALLGDLIFLPALLLLTRAESPGIDGLATTQPPLPHLTPSRAAAA